MHRHLPLHVRLFGVPRLELGGNTVALVAPSRTFALFAYLLLQRGAPVAREEVSAALWPHATAQQRSTNLRRHLHYLKCGLEIHGASIHVYRTRHAIRIEPYVAGTVDVLEFEAAARSEARFADALALYQGDLLEDHNDAWVEPLRASLRTRAIGMLQHLTERERALGDRSRALAWAERGLQIDPAHSGLLRIASALRVEGARPASPRVTSAKIRRQREVSTVRIL